MIDQETQGSVVLVLVYVVFEAPEGTYIHSFIHAHAHACTVLLLLVSVIAAAAGAGSVDDGGCRDESVWLFGCLAGCLAVWLVCSALLLSAASRSELPSFISCVHAGALRAQEKLDNRWFGGRLIRAELVDKPPFAI